MPVFSGSFEWESGLVWPQVGFAAGDEPLEDDPDDRLRLYAALVDTGASTTCISQPVADALDLQPIGRVDMHTAGGLVPVNMYDVHVALLIGHEKNPDGSVTSQFATLNNVRTLEFDAGDAPYRALIGRDVLRIGVLTQSPDGHYSFAF